MVLNIFRAGLSTEKIVRDHCCDVAAMVAGALICGGGESANNQRKIEVFDMKKLFISQPMRDKTDEEIKAERAEIIKRVTERFGEVEVIDSFFESAPHDARPLWFLGKSLELLSTADCAYFAEGWKDYRGCKIEHECAVQYGIDIVGE